MRDWWGMSIGDEQYKWLKDTLEQSEARYKFVFCHHVMGTGRGGIEMEHLYEWGGKSIRHVVTRPGQCGADASPLTSQFHIIQPQVVK